MVHEKQIKFPILNIWAITSGILPISIVSNRMNYCSGKKKMQYGLHKIDYRSKSLVSIDPDLE